MASSKRIDAFKAIYVERKMRNLILILWIGSLLVSNQFCRTVSYDNESSGRFTPGHDSEGTKPPLRVTDPNFPETRARLNNASIVDDSLRRKIAIEATNSRRTETQTLEVWAQVRNRTDFPLQIECHVLWYDRDLAPVDATTAWKRLYLEANSIGTYREFSTNVHDISYYYIEIREGK